MAALSTIIAGVGLGLGAVGTYMQFQGQQQAFAGQQKAERLRERQMNLQAARQRRDVIRQALRARSIAQVNATEQGASFGSGLAGGLGQIGNQTTSNLQGINQGVEIGSDMFKTNVDIASGQTLASFGGGLSSLGGSVYNSSGTLAKLGTYFSGGALT